MQKKEDLIAENIELRSRLEFAEKWMRREVATSITRIQKEKSKNSTRKSLANMFESEGLDIITKRILDQFDDSLNSAPKYSTERLIDAEIYWQTLQRYPQMDALPIILAYQKIFDAWIEERLISPFRLSHREVGSDPKSKRKSLVITGLLSTSQGRESEVLERDLQNIIYKNYTLSIGRFYQIISLVRDRVQLSPMTEHLIIYWQKEIPNTLELLISDNCYIPFSELVELEVFSRKRHEGKVSYNDAKRIREVMVDASSRKSFLEMIFSI
ncbi:hypothetical protein H7169_03360 [Candidatus Gracilibacteria bacterium]|nr:hypothetical protein [Candidatus Gracilibacteria bacterium]